MHMLNRRPFESVDAHSFSSVDLESQKEAGLKGACKRFCVAAENIAQGLSFSMPFIGLASVLVGVVLALPPVTASVLIAIGVGCIVLGLSSAAVVYVAAKAHEEFRAQALPPSLEQIYPQLEPFNLKACVDQTLDQAVDKLPHQLARGIGTLPILNDELVEMIAAEHRHLEQDQAQAMSMLVLYSLMNQLNQARFEYWGPLQRQAQQDVFDQYARQKMLDILTFLQNPQELKILANKTSSQLSKVSVLGHADVTQAESFLLIRMIQVFAERLCEFAIQRFEKLNIKPISCDEVLKNQNENKKYFCEKWAALNKKSTDSLIDLFESFNKNVFDCDGLVANKKSLIDLSEALSLFSSNKFYCDEPKILSWISWLNEKYCSFEKNIFSEESEEFLKRGLSWGSLFWESALFSSEEIFNQIAENKSKSTPIDKKINHFPVIVAEMACVSSAFNHLRQLRKKINIDAISLNNDQNLSCFKNLDFADVKNKIKQGLQGAQAVVLENDGSILDFKKDNQSNQFHEHPSPLLKKGSFSDLYTALESNRSGVPWHDGRTADHIELLSASMTHQVSSEQYAAVQDALIAFGEQVVQFLCEQNVKIVSISVEKMIRNALLHSSSSVSWTSTEDGDLNLNSDFIERLPASNVLEAEHLGYSIQEDQIISMYEPKRRRSQGIFLKSLDFFRSWVGRYQANERNVLLIPAQGMWLRGVCVHELGHALDFMMANRNLNQKNKNFCSAHSAENEIIKKEYQTIAEKNLGLSIYSQKNVREFFAESVEAYMGFPGFWGSYADPKGVDIYSQENLQRRHPFTHDLIQEVLRVPYDVWGKTKAVLQLYD